MGPSPSVLDSTILFLPTLGVLRSTLRPPTLSSLTLLLTSPCCLPLPFLGHSGLFSPAGWVEKETYY